jgi:hypothetical protein
MKARIETQEGWPLEDRPECGGGLVDSEAENAVGPQLRRILIWKTDDVATGQLFAMRSPSAAAVSAGA